ncbi:MAG: SprB repeat-containing protein, partial [Bacteroidia bacterium]|nr:SprB repeat-containing protein [Bacteroidia bacterium]
DSLGSWGSGMHDTRWMDSVFEPPYMKADYTATFTVSQQESEQKPEDNTMNISFLVRDSVYAHDQGIQTSEIAPSMYDGAADGDAMGTQFFVPIDDTVSSISVFIDDETTVGTMMTAELWKYDDVIGQWVLVIDGEEHIIEAADIDNWVTMKLTSEDGLQEYILGNTFYSAMISCTWGTDILWLGDDKSNTFVHAYNWETSLRLGTTWYWTTNTPMVRLNFCRSGIGCEPLMANVVPTNEICFGANDGTATALTAGGDGNFQYVWSNGGTNSSINNLAPGTYSVTITSPICLQDTVINFTISGSSQILNVSYVKTNPTCGLNNGTIDLTVTGGEVPYSFTWSNGATTANPDNLAEGSYYYTVTDYFGCEKTGFITLSDPFYLNFSMVATHISCFGQTDGSINLSVSGNGSPFTYVWSNSATTQDISGLSQGTYYVTITDVNGCTKVGSKGITEPALLETTLNATDISCFGVNDGSIDIVVSGGIAPYSFTWSTGATTEPLNNLAENIYYVTVSDHNSCPTVDSAEIAEPPLLESIIIHSDVICFGSANGSANLTGSGGTQPYSFIWSNGQTTEDIDSLLQGIYSVTVTDAHNCVTYNTTTIGTDPLITLSISTTNASCGASDGTATITPSGGVLLIQQLLLAIIQL